MPKYGHKLSVPRKIFHIARALNNRPSCIGGIGTACIVHVWHLTFIRKRTLTNHRPRQITPRNRSGLGRPLNIKLRQLFGTLTVYKLQDTRPGQPYCV